VPLAVRLRSAVCLLGRYPALAGVDLDVEEGEVVLVSGANGAGKTTLLRAIAGLVPLHSGTAEVLGHDLGRDRRGARRLLSLVGHETFCYEDLTVAENLRFAARAAARSAAGVSRQPPTSSGSKVAKSMCLMMRSTCGRIMMSGTSLNRPIE